MSDLQQIRKHAHDNIERLSAASAIVELDAEMMRAAIIDAIDIYRVDAEDGVVGKSTAQTMVRRLRELSRVPAAARADAARIEYEHVQDGMAEARQVLEGWKNDPTSSVFGGEPQPREHGDEID